jgi:hypothetical protein
MYYREPRSPEASDVELIARAVHVAGIAIERRRLDETLRLSRPEGGQDRDVDEIRRRV